MKYFFFIGTEAELIKIFPIMMEMNKRDMSYAVIASGQNDITHSRVLHVANEGKIDICLSDEKDIIKTPLGLLSWYITTRKKALYKLKKHFSASTLLNGVMIVHGDTVSTVMGAYLGKKLGMKVAHIEAGLRSHNWVSPFPEEIDRMLVSRVADYHFAPGDQAFNNLSKLKKVYNTKSNTLIDSLMFSIKVSCTDKKVNELVGEDYFVFVLHRQENLEDKELVHMILDQIKIVVKKYKCVIILHKITEIKFKEMGILDKFASDSRFVLLPRLDYFDFMKLLHFSQFVITDGGSNQEELSYMGKPTLIVRKTTERNEGLGENAVLYGGDGNNIKMFLKHPYDFIRAESLESSEPSRYIVEVLQKL